MLPTGRRPLTRPVARYRARRMPSPLPSLCRRLVGLLLAGVLVAVVSVVGDAPRAAEAATQHRISQFPAQGLCHFSDTFGDPRSDGRTHEGVDIIAPRGKYVYAAVNGVLSRKYVESTAPLTGNGWRLTRADGSFYLYAHLDTLAAGLGVGSVVSAGQILGTVGDSGNAGTPHLHFEVHPAGGAAVDPFPIVSAVDGCDTTVVPEQPGSTTPTTTVASEAVALADRWTFVKPVRVLDTGFGSVPANTKVTVSLLGHASLPGTTTGVMVRVRTRGETISGRVTLHRCGVTNEGTTLTVVPGRANATTSLVGVHRGAFCLTSTVAVPLVLEVFAVQSANGLGLLPINPRRALDTRYSGRLTPGTAVSVSGLRLGAPRGTRAVATTLTLLSPAARGTVSVGPCGGLMWKVPFTAAPTQVISGVVRVFDSGLCIVSDQPVHVIADVSGVWLDDDGLVAVGPQRWYDSRVDTEGGLVDLQGTIVQLPVPAGSTRGQFTLTVGGSTSDVTVWAWNCAYPQPEFPVTRATANTYNSVAFSLDLTGELLCLQASAPTRVVLDLQARSI